MASLAAAADAPPPPDAPPDAADENVKPDAPDAAARDAAAAKRQKAKDKKRRQKANRAAKKEDGAAGAAATVRRPSPGRGQGLFASKSFAAGDLIARAAPALSTVFDRHCRTVCGFCFAYVETEQEILRPLSFKRTRPAVSANVSAELRRRHDRGAERVVALEKNADGRVGVIFDENSPEATVLRVSAQGPNASADLEPDDVLTRVGGAFVADAAAAIAAIQRAPGTFEATVRRPNVVACGDCRKFATCRGRRAGTKRVEVRFFRARRGTFLEQLSENLAKFEAEGVGNPRRPGVRGPRPQGVARGRRVRRFS